MANGFVKFAPQQAQAAPLYSPERQMQMADMLRSQVSAPSGGRMVSGHYVAPSLAEGAARAFKAYTAYNLDKNATEQQRQQQRELSEALRTPGFVPEGIRDPNYQPPNLTDRLSGLENNPRAQELAMQLRLREATQQEQPRFQTLDPQQAQQMGLGEGVWQMSPTGQISQAYAPESPDYNKMIIQGPDGQPMVNPLYVQAREQIARAGSNKTSIDLGNLLGDGQPRTEIGTVPPGFEAFYNPETQGYQYRPIPGGPAAIEQEGLAQKAEAAQKQKSTYADIVTGNIDRVLEMVDDATIPVTGFGSYLSGIPGTTARDVKARVDTIRANVGFDRLQQMRDASPTGGALGQVSEMENRLLQSTLGNLELSQSEDQFKENLNQVKDIYTRIINQGIPETEAEGLLRNEVVGRATGSESFDQELLKYMTPEERALFE